MAASRALNRREGKTTVFKELGLDSFPGIFLQYWGLRSLLCLLSCAHQVNAINLDAVENIKVSNVDMKGHDVPADTSFM